MIQKILTFSLFLILSHQSIAQNATIVGFVRDADNDIPLVDASLVLSGTGKIAASGPNGAFTLEDVPAGLYTLVVSHRGYLPQDIRLNVTGLGEMRTIVTLRRDPNVIARPSVTDIPTITLEEAESETDGAGGVANLLVASRDVFQQISGFSWGNFRFRERGYDPQHFPLFLNGVNVNDPETGFAFFGEIGGLNDVLRNRESSIGLSPAEFSFAAIGGATMLDTRASRQRKQIRFSHAIANRTYTNRSMLTINTGLMPGGWAVSLSASRRWGQEGYFQGTFFDGYSYFASVDKLFGDKHSINLTVLGAPNKRGKQGDSFEEMFDLAGTNRYNPNWGYQNGEKRNAAVGYAHQPIAILRYDWSPQPGTKIMAALHGQAGKRGDTRLEWNDASNPAPDFNRRLPSTIADPALSAAWAEALRNDENLRQLDWHRFYDENRRNIFTVNNADGIEGNHVTGARSQYIIEDQRGDSREIGFNTLLTQQLNYRSKIYAGASYHWYNGKNFKVVDDLLGGDYWLDINRFASQDYPGEPDKEQNDLLNPNNVVRKGDVFGYNYDEHIRNGNTWFQITTELPRFQLYVGGEVGFNQFWREGKMQNGRFADNSLGKSVTSSFYTYGAKGGITYKATGRNYLYLNGYVGTKPPRFRDVFLSPRNRNDLAPGVDVFSIQSIEGGYIHRAPKLRTRVTGYLSYFQNEVESNLFFAQLLSEFSTIVRTGIDRRHIGVEGAFEWKPIPSIVLTGAGNAGYYHYTSRPLLYQTSDNTGFVGLDSITVYQKNFLVPRTPQTAASLGIKYEGKQFWFAGLTLNWTDNFWFSFDPTRRRAEAVLGQDPGSPIRETIISQRKAPAAYSLDFFGGKSWRLNRQTFLYLNVGINNILDNKNIIVSGREAYLNAFGREFEDTRLYTYEVMYAPGLNYFASLGIRL